jgi:hypothetical protein
MVGVGNHWPKHWPDTAPAARFHPNVVKILVADAVRVEPVSTAKFPANREKSREFCRIAVSVTPETVNNGVVTGLPMRIPYSQNRKLFWWNKESLAREQVTA